MKLSIPAFISFWKTDTQNFGLNLLILGFNSWNYMNSTLCNGFDSPFLYYEQFSNINFNENHGIAILLIAISSLKTTKK